MFDIIEKAQLHELHIKYDPETQLRAVVAIHNTRLGPALGGCRMIEYSSDQAAIDDAIRLSQGMSYKAALAGLPLGGGKSVIIKPAHIENRKEFFRSFAQFIDQLQGRYITAIDCGTSIEDMDIIHQHTPYVRGTSLDGDPSLNTAMGVFLGIKSCVLHQLKKDSLQGIHVAIQGLGKVGFALAQLLHQQGCQLSVTDINTSLAEKAAQYFHAEIIAPNNIYQVSCDVFAPCGLGAILDAHNIEQLNCQIVAGSANNQLANNSAGDFNNGLRLHDKGILYAPDYVINSGGLIAAALRHKNNQIEQKTSRIGHTLAHIFQQAKMQNLSTAVIAEQMAKSIIYGG